MTNDQSPLLEVRPRDTTRCQCPRCGNTSEHRVYIIPHGPQLGLVFLSKPLLGLRKYYLTCPVCGGLTREITKEQALALRGAVT